MRPRLLLLPTRDAARAVLLHGARSLGAMYDGATASLVYYSRARHYKNGAPRRRFRIGLQARFATVIRRKHMHTYSILPSRGWLVSALSWWLVAVLV